MKTLTYFNVLVTKTEHRIFQMVIIGLENILIPVVKRQKICFPSNLVFLHKQDCNPENYCKDRCQKHWKTIFAIIITFYDFSGNLERHDAGK